MKIFFSGVGGSGVSAIAGFMAGLGNKVTGSDRLFDRDPNHPLAAKLIAGGVSIVPQDGLGPDASFDLAVFSTAVEKDNPDFIAAAKLNIPVKSRPEYLAEIVGRFDTVAVAGTSGKSTTSGMLAFLMDRLGMSPNFIGGGRVKQFAAPSNPGNYLTGDSRILVIEACESDGSIVDYRPAHSIISNLDLDHHSVAETSAMFERLAENTSGTVVTGGDDLNLAACRISGRVGFSIRNNSRYQAREIDFLKFETLFSVNGQRFRLSMPGRHNLYNALACIAMLTEMGARADLIAGALPEFSGLERRFDIHLNNGTRLVVDDYAHNPHKIASLMAAVQAISRRVCYIFQPHGFGPTRMMKDGYIKVFSEGLGEDDRLIVLPIYDAGGTAVRDIASSDIAGPVAASGKSAHAAADRNDVCSLAGDYEVYVVFGARDDSLAQLTEEIAERLRNY